MSEILLDLEDILRREQDFQRGICIFHNPSTRETVEKMSSAELREHFEFVVRQMIRVVRGLYPAIPVEQMSVEELVATYLDML